MTKQHPTQQAAERRDEMSEINAFIHEKIAGKCWHTFERTPIRCRLCSKCGVDEVMVLGTVAYPHYTDSLDLIAPIEKIVIEKVGYIAYLKCLRDVTMQNFDPNKGFLTDNYVITATAEQRARAIVAAWKEHE